jgi:hypothetical protein
LLVMVSIFVGVLCLLMSCEQFQFESLPFLLCNGDKKHTLKVVVEY